MANRIALEVGINPTTLSNLVSSESHWNASVVSKTGDYGLTQINLAYHPEVTKEQALNPDFALRWTAEKIKAGESDIYVSCNCYALVKTQIPNLPKMKDVVVNANLAEGRVAIFYYGTVKHIGIVDKIYEKDGKTMFTIFEANKSPCLIGYREVSGDDPRLQGFYMPLKEG